MQTHRTFIESFIKTSASSPWVVSIASPTTSKLINVSIGEGGEIEAGPRLSEVLSIMERRIDAYPFQFTYHKLERNDVNDYFVRMTDDIFVYAEARINAYRALMSKDFLQYGKITFTNIFTELLPRNTYAPTQMTASYVPQDSGGDNGEVETVGNTDWMVVPEVSNYNIKDGDTLSFTVGDVGNEVGKYIKKGDEITIRYVGINCPEVKGLDVESSNQYNSGYCDTYKVTLDQAFEIGKEAKDYVTNTIGSKMIAVDLDIDNMRMPAKDSNGRYIGVVYVVGDVPPSTVISSGIKYGINLNKTLLITKSTKYPQAPLAEPDEHYVDDTGYNRFDVIQWLYELGIRTMTGIDTDKSIASNADKLNLNFGVDTEPDNTNDTDTLIIRYEESPDNRLQFVKALDDRQDTLFADGIIDDRVRIGDVCLVVPPLSIQVNRASTINREKTLRSKSSIMTKTVGSNQTITLQLYFHDLESINGTQWDNGHGMTYYMDGLRPLIAQFKKAPFLPIDNEYINNVLNIHDVALISLNVTTVPNFPQSIAATLTLAKFDNLAYMPGTASLGDVINYPLLRWYYQEAMKESKLPDGKTNPYRTWLKELNGPLTNDFKFSLASEAQLLQRQTAIRNLRNMDTPEMVKSKIDDGTTEIGKQIKDGENAQELIKIYKTWSELRSQGIAPGPDDSPDAIISYASNNAKYRQAWKEIYGEKATTGSLVTARDNWFAAPRSDAMVDAMPLMTQAWRDEYKDEALSKGVFRIKLYSLANVNMFEDGEVKGSTLDATKASLEGKGTYIILPGTDIQKLEQIVKRGYEAISSANDQIALYNKTQALVQQSEGALDLVEFPISGLIPMSMSVVYENTFIPIQMERNDCATLQYLGSQDPYVQVSFHADADGVARIRELLNEVERYSSQYRLGITSGFVGIENQLLQLFGVSTIMPETVTFATVEGMPGVTEIQMSIYGFDKTQKRMETLEGISPIYGTPDKESRHAPNYDSAKDNAVIENKMKQMEVYPDLELPEYEQLLSVLPNLGADMDDYENRTGSRFLDPDFYVSTEWTFREYLRQLKEKEHRVDFKDFAGISMYTSTLADNPMVPVDAASMESVYKLDNDTPGVADSFTDGNTTLSNQTVFTDNKGEPINKPADVKTIQDWLKVDSNVRTIPSMADWGKWVGWASTNAASAQAEYDAWLKGLQPTEDQVYMKIYQMIDSYLMGGSGFIYDDKKDTSDAWKKVTYASVNDVWYANYRVMASTNPKMPKLPNDDEKIKTSDYKKFAAITRERLANYFKSIFDVQSGWKQMRADNTPKTTFNKSKGVYVAGIGGIDIAAFAKDVSDAKRLLWDWAYNLEVTVSYLSKIYLQAAASDNINYMSHPWDWMVYGFGEGKFDQDTKSAYYETVIRKLEDTYNDYNTIYATPTYAVNPKIMMIKDGLTEYQYELISGEKETLLSELKKAGMSQGDIDKLKKQSASRVRTAYENYMKTLFDPNGNVQSNYASATVNPGDESDIAEYQATKNRDNDKYKEVYNNYMLYVKIHNMAEEEENRLVGDVDQYTLFKEMFIDMIYYDMRGRLVRAFPTFQMFVIDEGRWMGTYKLWDNLYGYNAIQSIDVHRSRKIAADTAIIKMTNVYSNLTSRPMSDMSPDTDNYDFWDNLVFQNPNEKILESRKQLLQAMLLDAGARLHLRIGYGSNVEFLPVVFNGTITEIDTGEIVEIVAQGDGLELCNVITADPDDENKYWWGKTKEPRDFLCELMTSKGNWVKNVINWASEGKFLKDNPLGIQHFGNPMGAMWANVTWDVYNKDYGECAQNIYSANGLNTFSDFVYNNTGATSEDKLSKERPLPFTWDGFIPKFEGDEPNIKLKLYGQTVWDVTQTLAAAVPDYIAAVHPFETRSTLFYGKPYWRLAYRYSSQYQYNKDTKEWDRTILAQHRKPYMQFHIADSHMDIINNKIQASADFSNVILVKYDGDYLAQPIYADYDIHFAQQRTKEVKVNIVSKPKWVPGWAFFTSEKQAMYAGMSILRDECKDMYQGELVLLGSPSIKPYDMLYLNDTMHEMNGNILVKSVTHHFSYDTGFVTSVEPDALVVNDDKAMMAMANWAASAGIQASSTVLGVVGQMYARRKVFTNSLVRKAVEYGKKGATKSVELSLKGMLKGLPTDDEDVKLFKSLFEDYLAADAEGKKAGVGLIKEAHAKIAGKVAQWEAEGMFEEGVEVAGKNVGGAARKIAMKGLVSSTGKMVEALEDGTRAFKLLRAAQVLTDPIPLAIILDLAVQWGVETLLEQWRRKKACYQAVLMMPLKYQGREYTAGINGHMGMVYGDTQQGKMDNFLSGLGFEDGNIFDTMFQWYGEAMNTMSGEDRKFTYSKPEDLASTGGGTAY